MLASGMFAGILLSTAVLSQTMVLPEPIFQEGRFMPGFGNEAIVTARYTVKTDGKTEDVELIGEFSNPSLETMLKNTVSDWVFKPGTYNGEASNFYNQEWVFVLRVDPNAPQMPMGGPGGRRGGPPAPPACAQGEDCTAVDFMNPKPIPLALSPGVKEGFELISELIGKQDFPGAEKELKKLERRELHTVFDFSLVNDLKATVFMAEKQYFEALEAIRLATLSAKNPAGETEYFLTSDILRNSLIKQIVLATAVRQNKLALDTYEALVANFDIPADDNIHQQGATLRAAMDSPDPLPALAKIINKSWAYTPSRRIFTVTDVKGSLKRIDAHCEHNNLELDYVADVDWTLPDSLGKCSLEFNGKNGTTFTIYEFAE